MTKDDSMTIDYLDKRTNLKIKLNISEGVHVAENPVENACTNICTKTYMLIHILIRCVKQASKLKLKTRLVFSEASAKGFVTAGRKLVDVVFCCSSLPCFLRYCWKKSDSEYSPSDSSFFRFTTLL
uniref:Uncharacterized protein n=1 Tax=Glossina austeni TaxID=7395 RepID=A0A1A9VX91_GLOAU